MSVPDPTAAAAIEAEVIKPVFFAWLDIDGDPVRANSSGHDITPSGTGDSDLDGELFIGIGAGFVDISSVKVSDQGTESVTATLSGIQELDTETLNTLGDAANWQGRVARLWRVIRDASNIQQGGFQPFYTGYMTSLEIGGSETGQTISVSIETYLAAFSTAPNRTYLDQGRYDVADESPRAAIAIANGVSGVVGNTPTGGVGSGGGGGSTGRNFSERLL